MQFQQFRRRAQMFSTVLAFLVLFSMSGREAAAQTQPVKTPTGFYNPIGVKLTGDANFGYCGAQYISGLRHNGADIFYDRKNYDNNIGKPVYAVADGTVVAVSGPTECSGWGADNYALAIQHASDAGDFIAVYGHIRTKLVKGSKVKAGDVIGSIGPYQWHSGSAYVTSNGKTTCKVAGRLVKGQAHLHFGVFPGTAKNFPSSGWGRVSDPHCNKPNSLNGFVKPVTWINTKRPVGSPSPGPTPTPTPTPRPSPSPTPTPTPTQPKGKPSMTFIKKSETGTRTVELHVLLGDEGYRKYSIQTGTGQHTTGDEYTFRLADYDRDGVQDLVGIKKNSTGSGKLEVHIASGASGYRSFIVRTATPQEWAWYNYDFEMTDWDRDQVPDLVIIKKNLTGTRSTELHILSGASKFQRFIINTGTAEGETGDNYEFQFADFDRDKKPDLAVIKKNSTGTGSVELHVLSGASGFKRYIMHSGTAQHPTGNEYTFKVGDYDLDGVPDLIGVKKNNTGTGKVEVHVLSGASGFSKWLLRTGTPQEQIWGSNYDITLFGEAIR